jgi:hypothetical protein
MVGGRIRGAILDSQILDAGCWILDSGCVEYSCFLFNPPMYVLVDVFRCLVWSCRISFVQSRIFESRIESSIFPPTIAETKGEKEGNSYTTICLRASRGLRMNLRVRRVTGVSAILVVSW